MSVTYQVHLSFLAWSQTSCSCGSYWTMMVFSMKLPCGVGVPKPSFAFELMPHERSEMSKVTCVWPRPDGTCTQFTLE